MTELAISVVGARAEPYAATPTLMFQLGIEEDTGARIHSIVLRGQVRIEPQRRPYQPGEEESLRELFGAPSQWKDSLRPFLWAHVVTSVGGFTGATVVDLPMPCTYDFEVAATKYLHALGGGEIPVVMLFNGTVYTAGERGVQVEPVAWHTEAEYRLPVATWREVMDAAFPNSGWMRVHRDTLDAVQRYKTNQGHITWDQTLEALLKEAGEEV